MTKISLEDTRRMFGDTCTVWGGIPSISVLEESMNDLTFKRFVEEKFDNLGKGDHLIMSVADTVPPAAKFDRILYLKKKAEEFGPVRP